MVARSRRTSNRPDTQNPAEAEARWLRDAASEAVAKGRYAEALNHCLRLEALQPGDPAWARRTAHCCQRLGRRGDERAALLRAAEGYERAGFLRKACAMYRLAVATDPTDANLERRLAELSAGQVTGLDSVNPPGAVPFYTASEPPVPATPVAPGTDASVPRVEVIPKPPSVPDLESDDDRLTDEYDLVEFTDTDVTPK